MAFLNGTQGTKDPDQETRQLLISLFLVVLSGATILTTGPMTLHVVSEQKNAPQTDPQKKPSPTYVGQCDPNTPNYRKDLKDWRYGDERDFECFMLDEY
jgi:hypothetical protein